MSNGPNGWNIGVSLVLKGTPQLPNWQDEFTMSQPLDPEGPSTPRNLSRALAET